ncbi:uncharacterized protein LTR77_005059 [Saxophila tyrrhenica]|uniref:NmrA-like domain-containing protein n=1 Tax=Saxophila tyrrhenica TaxID=1690608 RepID=A0AAV9PBA9_9PEZI|nr:hypothetical protein LTR77_005059 [Saxophila tyrrhenica]
MTAKAWYAFVRCFVLVMCGHARLDQQRHLAGTAAGLLLFLVGLAKTFHNLLIMTRRERDQKGCQRSDTSKQDGGVTCLFGRQCSHLIPLLYNKGQYKLRLAAHSQDSAKALESRFPDAEVAITDLTSLASCQKLLHGATSVYHVGPSFHSREKEMGFNMIDAAVAERQRSGNVFEHFVFASVLSTQHRNLMQHDLKSYVEERLFLSPLNWTILKPTNFMDAYPVAMLAQQEKPVLERLWNVEVPNSMIALRDLAEAAAKVLTEREKHYLAEYPLCSTMPLSDRQVAEAISKRTGKEITCVSPPHETGVRKVLTWLFGMKETSSADLVYADTSDDAYAGRALANTGDLRADLAKDEAERLILFYNRRGLLGSPNVLRWVLGREPTTLEEWIESQMKEAGLA